jgi:hypothetical protein
MKQICDERGWTYDPHKDTAKALIGIMIQNELVPKWVMEQFRTSVWCSKLGHRPLVTRRRGMELGARLGRFHPTLQPTPCTQPEPTSSS